MNRRAFITLLGGATASWPFAARVRRQVPIVFTAVGDPVGAGVVVSLAPPGGNAIRFSGLATELGIG